MPPILPDPLPARPRQKLADVVLEPAKAALRPQPRASQLRVVAGEAIRRVTSQKAAAIEIGMDESRLSHKIRDGSLTLGQLEALGPVYAAELGRALVTQYGEAIETARERALRVLPELFRELLATVA